MMGFICQQLAYTPTTSGTWIIFATMKRYLQVKSNGVGLACTMQPTITNTNLVCCSMIMRTTQFVLDVNMEQCVYSQEKVFSVAMFTTRINHCMFQLLLTLITTQTSMIVKKQIGH